MHFNYKATPTNDTNYRCHLKAVEFSNSMVETSDTNLIYLEILHTRITTI